MKHKEEWFNDDDFWEQYAPIMFDENRWSEVPAVAKSIAGFVGVAAPLTRPLSVVDLCCGFGRITLELARLGFAATGVDITASYLRTANEDAASEGLKIEYIQNDVRTFKREKAFDVAINLYNSFGFFADPKDDALLLKNAYTSLRVGGTMIIDVQGKELAVRDYIEAEWFERAGYIVLTETMPVDSWGSLSNRWVLLKNAQRLEKVFIQRLYAASELRALVRAAGFSKVEIYGGWDKRDYDQDADTLIVIGRK